eukprot:s917_g9.t1
MLKTSCFLQGNSSDEQLWEVLRLVGLDARIRRAERRKVQKATVFFPAGYSETEGSDSFDEERREEIYGPKSDSGLDAEVELDYHSGPRKAQASQDTEASPAPREAPRRSRRNPSEPQEVTLQNECVPSTSALARIEEQPRPSGALPEASPIEHSPGTDRAPVRNDSAATAGPRKLQLSSSQRRIEVLVLLVLARLLLRRHTARLVLLDEPFAGMEQNEVTPLHSMLKIQLKHAALMTVTHRLLPVIHFFSRILVFHEGRCSEDASPSELLLREGHVQQLFQQAPKRLQAHVERMMALKRSEGLSAVQGLLLTVGQVARPEPAGPVRARNWGVSKKYEKGSFKGRVL